MKLKVGVVGARRGRSLVSGLRAVPDSELIAICDLDPNRLAEVGEELGVEHRFEDCETMLDSGLINVVVVATPQNLHADQAIEALARGINVLSEVPAATDLDQCCRLVDAVRASDAVYMISENCNYTTPNLLVSHMVKAGVFGDMYFAEGEYTHDLKALSEETPWRRIWQTGRNGLTYPTHQLGPVLQWTGQRIVSLTCLGSGHHYTDPRGDMYEQEDCILMLCRTDTGGLIKIRQDIISDRPHITTAFSLQGTGGCYESARVAGEDGRVWLADRAPDATTWTPLMDFAEEFLPEEYRSPSEEVAAAGHGGSDYWVARDFADAITQGIAPALDVYFAMDISVPGIVSEESIERGGAPVMVPDFRNYVSGSGVVPHV